MKWFIYPIVEVLIIACFMMFVSCSPRKTIEYQCEITYLIDDQTMYTDTVSISMSEGYVPTYAQGKCEIFVDVYPQGSPWTRKVIYVGTKDAKVMSFTYKPVRTYYRSSWDGREVKRKKVKSEL